jgi:hypothetical protein
MTTVAMAAGLATFRKALTPAAEHANRRNELVDYEKEVRKSQLMHTWRGRSNGALMFSSADSAIMRLAQDRQ